MLAISAGAVVLDYGSGWKEMRSLEPLLLREDSEIELGRCHGRTALSQAHFVDRRADGTPVGGYPVNEVR